MQEIITLSKKAKKKKPNKPNSAPSKGSVARELNTKLTLRTWLMGRTVVTLAGPTILASYAIYAYFWKNGSNPPVESTWGDAVVIALVVFSLLDRFFVMGLDLAAKFSRVRESAKQRSLRSATSIKGFNNLRNNDFVCDRS